MHRAAARSTAYTIGYTTILTFFDKMDPPRPEIDVKWVLRHNYRTHFSFFEPLHPIFALKLAKVLIEANRSKKTGLEISIKFGVS